MTAFRTMLGMMFLSLLAYTAVVVSRLGLDTLFPTFFGDMARVGWPGQFNLDFTFMLALSATWVAWRHRFSPAGLGLATFAFFGGASFLTVYLVVTSLSVKDDVAALLLGPDRAAELRGPRARGQA
ncbi:hypothetical protein KGQ64_03965 [bacterium]|nr:hypothetical protein [bacterium]